MPATTTTATSEGLAGKSPAAPTSRATTGALPDWYPPWARSLAELYFSGTTCLFVVYGNVHDLIRCPSPIPLGADGVDSYCNLSEFLAAQVFGSWDVVVQYDLARGLRASAGGDGQRLQGMMQYLSSRLGDPTTWVRDPDTVLLALERLVERTLLEDDPSRRKSLGIVFDYAQYVVPAGDLGSLARGQGTNLVRFLSWAQNPYIKRVNIAFCLIADRLAEVNDRLVQSPHVAVIEIPLPDRDERERYCVWSARSDDFAKLTDFTPGQLAELSNGLSLTSLSVLLSQGKNNGTRVDQARFKKLKKTMIERQCQGLVEFVEPRHTLDLVVGQEAAKDRLKQDAELILKGQLDAAPMGYLLCGPVGTGKSFLAECYAGSIGIPCVKLRNFRSKYVGETEANLEQVLGVLRSLGPVVVLIDEADATLGTREADGDSGISSRVFAMIASQMGDTRYRGQIIWMLMTSRPELLPVDLKRQGRAEVHIPLFYPQNEVEVREMFRVLAKKNKVTLADEALPSIKPDRFLSGSDIESIVLAAKRQMLTSGRQELTRDDIESAFHEFIPSAQGLEKEMQELAAVLECTQLVFLPQMWREKVLAPEGRSQMQERLMALKSLLKD
ncbi:MAG: ATP-binding protein [Planctomycetaceae bacterium]|nr:ATP-binding protein [Planctomycetaceae bacterium]